MAIPVVAIGIGSLAIYAVDKLTDLIKVSGDFTEESSSFIKQSGITIAVVLVFGVIAYQQLRKN